MANTAVAIFRINDWWGVTAALVRDLAVIGKLEVKP
jgi:hypothetical protein